MPYYLKGIGDTAFRIRVFSHIRPNHAFHIFPTTSAIRDIRHRYDKPLPTKLVVAPEHKGSLINSAFATELGDFIESNRIKVWIYGHSHTIIDTEIVSNQLGYSFWDEHLYNGCKPGKCIEI